MYPPSHPRRGWSTAGGSDSPPSPSREGSCVKKREAQVSVAPHVVCDRCGGVLPPYRVVAVPGNGVRHVGPTGLGFHARGVNRTLTV
jgi:hypothetical protein